MARNTELLGMIADASLDLATTWDTGNVSPYAKCLGLGYVLHAGAELQAPAIKHLGWLDQNRAARIGARARAIKWQFNPGSVWGRQHR